MGAPKLPNEDFSLTLQILASTAVQSKRWLPFMKLLQLEKHKKGFSSSTFFWCVIYLIFPWLGATALDGKVCKLYEACV